MISFSESELRTGRVIWLYGRPCAGKTSIARKLAEVLKQQGNSAITLDGDELRKTLNADLGFSAEDRFENIRRTSELAKILAHKGFDVICSFVTPTQELRDLVRRALAGLKYQLVFVNTSLETCISRDTKGYYKKALAGKLDGFTGIGSPFEEPNANDPDFVLETQDLTIEELVKQCLKLLKINRFEQ